MTQADSNEGSRPMSISTPQSRSDDPSGRTNSIGLSGRALDTLLHELDGINEGGANPKREFVRWPHRLDRVFLKVRQPGGQESVIRVVCRNLSRGGMAILHNAYMHPRSKCAVVLPHLLNGPTVIEGTVVRCQHRRGVIHEVGIRFGQSINVRDYVPLDPFADCFSLERVKPSDLRGCLVVVDDSELDQKIVQHFLRETDLRVRAALSPEQGMALVSEGCDIILMDYYLGESTGADFVSRIRGAGDRTPVIMMTCDTSTATRQRVLGAQANGFLSKPLNQDLLLRALGEYLIAEKSNTHLRTTLTKGDPALRLVSGFVRDLRGFADRLEQAIGGDDAMKCRALCLEIHGSAPALGFGELGTMADKAAATLAASMSIEESRDMLRVLIAACRRVEVPAEAA